MFSAKANDRLGRLIGIRSSEQGHRSVKPCKLSIGGGRVVAFFVEGAIRSERSGQFIPKEGEACLRISLKVSSRLDGNPSAIVNLFHQLKEPPVFRVLRGTPGPKPAMGIGEVKMDNLLASAPDDLRILIHHPQVIVIDDHRMRGRWTSCTKRSASAPVLMMLLSWVRKGSMATVIPFDPAISSASRRNN